MIKAANKTNSTQQILFADGSSVSVLVDGDVRFNSGDIFPEEMDRIKNFFEISEIQEEKKLFDTPKKAKYEGGNE